jgi:HSP20 family molecular chaperone IbpA
MKKGARSIRALGSKDILDLINFETEVREFHEFYLISLNIEGLRKEELRVFCNDNVIFIQGEHSQEELTPFRSQVKTYSSFSHSFPLPKDADQERIKAVYKEGVLSVTILKKGVADELYPGTSNKPLKNEEVTDDETIGQKLGKLWKALKGRVRYEITGKA